MQHLVCLGLVLNPIVFGAALLKHSHQQLVRCGSMYTETYGPRFGKKFFCFGHGRIVAPDLCQGQVWNLRTWNE